MPTPPLRPLRKGLISSGALLMLLAAAAWQLASPEGPASAPAQELRQTSAAPDAARIAFEQGARGRMIAVSGRVVRTLADDRDGSPHQRFIIHTSSGVSLLIAHNLDLAPRLEGLAKGDEVKAYGEYEWNEQGGVLHWTHDDPAGRHESGYIEWRGRRYQ